MQSSRNKIIVLVLGILVSLVVLEMSLRFIGIVYSRRTLEDNMVKKEPGAFVILCLGDSFTYGFGTTYNSCYPSQLERLFQKKYPEKKRKVVNKGVGAFNTTMLLEGFDENVNEVDPDLIIILAGGANEWNVYGYGDHLNRKDLGYHLRNFLYNIKIFKLIKLFFYEDKNKKKHLLKNDVVFSSKGRKFAPQQTDWWKRGNNCEREGKYDDALFYYKKILEENPLDFHILENLARTYFEMGKVETSRQYFRKLIEADPGRHQSYTLYAVRFIQDPVRDKEDLQFIQQYASVNPVVGDILKSIKDKSKGKKEIGNWITHDIEEMIKRSRERGIEVILQNYPDYSGRIMTLNSVLREVARRNSVFFIDNEKIFEGLFLKGEHKDEYFSFDKSHCNKKGYGVMAENIYNCILENRLIKKRIKKDPQ